MGPIFILNDARKSVLARTAFNGEAVVEEAEYDAWGATENISDLPAPTHQFTGVEPDPVVGLYHFGVRAYDPTLRRWLSPDPLLLANPSVDVALAAELDLYSYAANNPVRYTDPTGMLSGAGLEGWTTAKRTAGGGPQKPLQHRRHRRPRPTLRALVTPGDRPVSWQSPRHPTPFPMQ